MAEIAPAVSENAVMPESICDYGIPLPVLLEAIVESAPVAIIVSDANGLIRLCNRQAQSALGYEKSEMLGHCIDMLVPQAQRQLHHAARLRFLSDPSMRAMGEGRPLLARRKDSTTFPVEVALQPICTPHGPLVISMVIDISERECLLAELRHAASTLEQQVHERTAELQLAYRDNLELLEALRAKSAKLDRLCREDPLTGLANRREFGERLDTEIHRADSFGLPLSLALFDIDHFKQINDHHGHAVGDLVLRASGTLLRKKCRSADTVARFGGEEFALMMPNTDLLAATALCEGIRHAFATFSWDALQEGIAVTLCAGVSRHVPGAPVRSVLAAADANLYSAKNRGRNCVVGGHDDSVLPQ
ncbi:PAS domain S-box-containing protein/diguanylate cyclase (GGDEF)-like protein [Tahibacter aquaticus]|uniref:diguanylate cyclase n=1 Tax=Tahibacter aquaticus TaxID=520092 RepID=A0A4R6YL38_9GAMM|nr:sensor domain-containing diguanylate cyclase [Tahibacter aquaticus]TDR37748.1 PAS domain S-box-containing protein/diguanylate cyclase (GGDEF)-like protein [Tahibacter aquaticus]